MKSRLMLNCGISKDTRKKMNEHISKKGTFQYRFIEEAILEKIEKEETNE